MLIQKFLQFLKWKVIKNKKSPKNLFHRGLSIRQRKPLIYAELWENENRENSFNLLKDIGYSIFVIENEQLVPFNEGTHRTQNFIFKQSSIS